MNRKLGVGVLALALLVIGAGLGWAFGLVSVTVFATATGLGGSDEGMTADWLPGMEANDLAAHRIWGSQSSSNTCTSDNCTTACSWGGCPTDPTNCTSGGYCGQCTCGCRWCGGVFDPNIRCTRVYSPNMFCCQNTNYCILNTAGVCACTSGWTVPTNCIGVWVC
jgi:hypothetical protein